MQTVFLGRVRGKQSVNALFQTVTGLQDRAYQGWRDVHKNSEGIRAKCKAECGADGWPVSDYPTTRPLAFAAALDVTPLTSSQPLLFWFSSPDWKFLFVILGAG
jgi:hypothetical protein